MALFDKLKKLTPSKASSIPEEDIYPIQIVFWDIHYDEISALFDDLNLGSTIEDSIYLSCKVTPEPTNEVDKNAIAVYASAKGKSKKWHKVGYIPSDMTSEVKKDSRCVKDGSHYWNLLLWYNRIEGSKFTLALYESKFK
ncbi:MAG: HIRAN domain-containing protein [Solobacterium sp.]|nr:HIRAN domain-containing protein [Solobacterium sp.]